MRLKYVLRRLAAAPIFTLLTIATLAVGIGANTAIFSVINGILLKPLPYPRPDELIVITHSAPGINFTDTGIAPFLYFTYLEQGRTFAHFGIWTSDSLSITGLAEPEQVNAIDVTFDLLPALGVQPVLGRWFSEKDDSPDAPRTAVLTYPYWQTRFGGDRSVIGRRIVADGQAHEIIGVMPENFRFLDRQPALLVPMRLDRAKTLLGNFHYRGIARLKTGVSITQASADMARLIPVALRSFPPLPGFNLKMFEDARLTATPRPLKDDLVGDIRKTLWVLMSTIGIVLLIACANVANLLLVRAEGRRHELAIRAALGAGWNRIIGELLMESVTLAVLGGIAGVGLAYGALKILLAMAPANLPRLDQISIDGNVVLFTLAVSVLAGLLFGAVPAIKAAGRGVSLTLRAGGRSMSQSREGHRARNALVIVQVAMALVLLIGSGLMIRTFQALKTVKPGFTDPAQVETMEITIPESQVHDPVATVRMEQAILDKLNAIPGVFAAAGIKSIPMTGNDWRDPIYAEGHVYPANHIPPLRRYQFISPGLLKAMGYSLVAGREFTWTDIYEQRPVAMLSENLARELWGDPANAIGKQVREFTNSPWREVVGVIGDEREDGVDQKAPTIAYWPILASHFEGNDVALRRTLTYVIRSPRAGTQSFLKEIQAAVWSVNPNLPLAQVRTLEAVYEKSLARTSFTLVMLAIAGGMALLIGLVGIYGVVSYSVSQRTREIGIRIALGAQHGAVTGMFLRHALLLAATGAGAGLVIASLLVRFISSLLFGVSALDPLTYAGVSIVLIAAVLIASAIPARRATSIDPLQALRTE
jgi:putative ABC transport system permease protein